MAKSNFPKDWEGPMKRCAALLKEFGVKVKWNDPIVQNMMLWGFESLLFYEINHGKGGRYEIKPTKRSPGYRTKTGIGFIDLSKLKRKS